MTKLVTIITATTSSDLLKRNLESVQNQTYKNIQHLVFIDGKQYLTSIQKLIDGMVLKNVDFVPLPYSTGNNRWNGHRMYFAGISLAKEESEFIIFLDEDNYIDNNHIESLINVVSNGNDFAFSLRKIVDKDNNFVCNDDCESLGLWSSILSEQDYFIDLNCIFLPRNIAIQLAPIFYRKAREPGVPEIDRTITAVLRQNNIKYDCNYEYTLNYMTGNTERSVQSEFFIDGNKRMLEKLNNELPWIKLSARLNQNPPASMQRDF